MASILQALHEELLQERRSGRKILRTLKNRIVRDVMSVFKGALQSTSVSVNTLEIEDYDFLNYPSDYFLGVYELGPYQWEKNIDVSSLTQDELDDLPDPEMVVTIAMIEDPTRTALNVAGGSHPASGLVGIDIVIEVPPNFSQQKYGELHGEIDITVLHELEHLTQQGDLLSFDRGPDYYDVEPAASVGKWAAHYLLDPKEIAAHVVGFASAADSMADLKNRMVHDLENYVRLDRITEKDKDAVLETWLVWAKKHLKQKRFLS